MAEYGLPYMGSKDRICDELIKIFPKTDHFYDLFGGGFSVTHAMLLRRKNDYNHFHFNEIRPGICELIEKAIAGEYSYSKFKPPFVSREEFLAKLNQDAYLKICWSFGNNGMAYLFSKEIEPYKKSMHNAIVFNEFDNLAEKTLGMKAFKADYSILQKRLYLRNRIEFFRKTKIPDFLYPYLNEEQQKQVDEITQLRQLQQLEQLERLERLQQLQQLERLTFYNTSYEQVPINPNSVIYCDIPYQETADYDDSDTNKFDHLKFFDWADNQTNPVFISEYNISDKRFVPIFKINKRSLMSSDKTMNQKVEKVYANLAAVAALDASRKTKRSELTYVSL